MKQFLITLLASATGLTPAMAQSMLKVSLTDRRPISVSVDGRHFRKTGESVTVNDLPKGRHYVVVYVTETLRDGRQADGVIWEGTVKTYRGEMSVCLVDPHTREANVTEQDMYYGPDGQQYNNYNLNNYDNKNDGGYNQPDNATPPGNMYNRDNAASPPAENTMPDNENLSPVPDGSPVASPVSSYDEDELLGNKKGKTEKGAAKIDRVKKKVNEKGTDTDKLNTAKTALTNSTMTTADVMSLMDCFNFESTKLEFAEWAYDKTSDKNNFKKVKQKLTMKNYKEEMDAFLKTK